MNTPTDARTAAETPVTLATQLGVAHWSDDHFSVDEQGRMVICLPGQPPRTLSEIVEHCRQQGLNTPLLLRFPQILAQRAQALEQAFQHSLAQQGLHGEYRVIYPIKVNQQHSVVAALSQAGQGRNGLEAGSKAELLAVMALAQAGSPLICNGYKDAEYIELACIAAQMGLRPVIVIEQASEWATIRAVFEGKTHLPRLGLRLRLRSIGYGKWQNTGGAKAKFGLSAAGVLALSEAIRQAGYLEQLQVLHFHMGSQISNIRDIQRGVQEAARFYVAGRAAGLPLNTLDVGGGLGVDYEGAHTRSACSMNYGFEQYAQTIVHVLQQACESAGQPVPAIWSESGRALTAHHALLVTEAHSLHTVEARAQPPEAGMAALYQQLGRRPAEEIYYEAEALLEEAHDAFLHGQLALEQWAQTENSHRALGLALLQQLDPANRRHQPVLDELRERLAGKLFLNFSVFRSAPDSWAIEQLFPVAPLAGLHRPPAHTVMVEDLTCDSDGRLDAFPLNTGVESTLPIPAVEDNPQGLYGIFLLGAYQEVLGDNHNLFGLPHAVDIVLEEERIHLDPIQPGDTLARVLAQVGYTEKQLESAWQQHMSRQNLPRPTQKQLLQRLQQALAGYTYLTQERPSA